MDFSLFSPAARRRNRELRRRLQTYKLKAYDKFKLEQEQHEAEVLKNLQLANKDDLSDKSETSGIESHGLYYLSEKKDTWDTEDDDSFSSEKSSAYSLTGARFFRCCRKLFASNMKYELKWKEFFCITFCLQMPIAYIFRHITMVKKWGSCIVLIVYLATTMSIAMPLYMVYMFLGNYSRRSYIKYWEAVPLLKGIAYSIALTSIMMEICNISIAGMALWYIKIVLTEGTPWMNCKFSGASEDCIPFSNKLPQYNKTCCDEHRQLVNCTYANRMLSSAKFATFDYYVNSVLRRGYDDTPTYSGVHWQWIVATEMCWALLFLLTLMGLRRFRGFMTTINLIIYVIFIPVGIMTLIVSPQHHTSQDLDTEFKDLLEFKFWIETCVHTFHRELPGDVITFSSVSRPGISTTVDTLTVYSTKSLFMIILTVWLAIAMGILQDFYNVTDGLCIQLEGDLFLFAIIPDLISHWMWPELGLIIYFAIVFFWGFSTAVYVVNSFLEAMLEQFPSWVNWRLVISAVLCSSVGVANSFLLKADYMSLNRKFLESTYVQIRMTLLFLSILGLFLYSVDRLKGDYHFTYGTMLGTYWVSGIKIAMLLIVILSFVTFLTIFKSQDTNDGYLEYCLSIAPVAIGMIVMTARYVLMVSKTLISPDPKWGPPGRKKRMARLRFDPTHDLHYMSSQRCNHDCLLGSTALRKEMKYWHNKKYMFGQIINQESEAKKKNK